MPPASPSDSAPFTAEALRAWAVTHPVVEQVTRALPARERGTGDGLFVDAAPAPGIHANGTTRVSALRVVSVVGGDARLVGQVHVTERVTDAGVERVALTLVHDAEFVAPSRARDPDAWWLRVLDAHYARGGAPVFADAPVSA